MADRNGYIGRSPADSSTVVARQIFQPTSDTTTFTFASGYSVGYLDVYLNGSRLVSGAGYDYRASDGSTIILNSAAVNGDVVEVVAYKAFNATTVDTAPGNLSVGGNLTVINDTTISGDLLVSGVSTFQGNVSIAGTLTYEDVTNIDSVGLITARSGAIIKTGTATTALLVEGDARITGILTVGTGSITIDGTTGNSSITGVTTVGVTSAYITSINNLNYPTAGPLSNRNMLINGDMRIAQRGSSAVTGSSYPVDRWLQGVNTSGAVSAQRSTAVTPDDFGYSIVCTVTTADATTGTTDFWNIQQIIEGFDAARLLFGTANAQSVTVSFWVRGSVTGTYCVILLGSSDGTTLDRSYVSEYTIASADTWEYKTITVPGDTGGTWTTDNGRGLSVRFGLTAGSNFQQAAGSWGTTNAVGSSNQTQLLETLNATWYVAGVQLEVGSVATPFENRNYADELAKCQRYYQALGVRQSSGQGFSYTFLCPMRITPSGTSTGNAITVHSTAFVISSGGSSGGITCKLDAEL